MKKPLYNAWHSLLHNRRQFCFAIFHRLSFLIPDDAFYLRVFYWLAMGKNLPLNNPKTFNEKLQWLKLYNRKPEYTMMVDKVAVKDYVTQLIGHEYIIPTLGVWDNAREIEWDKLPDQFVLKTNHDSGNNGVIVVKDGATLKCDKKSQQQIIRRLNKSLRKDSYLKSREWPYKMVKHKVFAEQYMEDKQYGELRDYKFFCFDGEVKMLFVAMGRSTAEHAYFNYFDTDFKPLNIKNGHPISNEQIAKPQSFELMKKLASKLSKGIPHVRVDFYEVDGHPYFGELTFFHMGGTGVFEPKEWNLKLGDWITLPEPTDMK